MKQEQQGKQQGLHDTKSDNDWLFLFALHIKHSNSIICHMQLSCALMSSRSENDECKIYALKKKKKRKKEGIPRILSALGIHGVARKLLFITYLNFFSY